MMRERSFWKAFGPGVLFAGAAVGVSHLVQSTRAGAAYGLTLLVFVLAANLAKYPAFRFGPQYAAATGRSLLQGYRRQGMWALVVYALVTVGTMFTVQAAVTIVTAGLAKELLGLSASPVVISGGLLIVCAALIGLGRYHWLDRISKVVVALLTVSTVVATVVALPRMSWADVSLVPDFGALTKRDIFFIAALVGWMPSAIDVAVWQSLWTLARGRDSGQAPSVREALLDFHIGYWGTVVLALCFLVLGAGVMHPTGQEFSPSAGAFAAQVIALYTDTLGAWSRPLIGVAACSVMFSTTLTVVDGFPRALSILVARFRTDEQPAGADADQSQNLVAYWIALAVLAVGSLAVLHWYLTSLKTLVDVATTLSFLTAPILAVLNHRAITSTDVPQEHRPAGWLVAASWAGIVVLGGFSAYYLMLRYG